MLLPNFAGGGAERVMLVLAGAFLQRGLAVEFVVLRAAGELLDDRPPGSTTVQLGVDRFRAAFRPLLDYLRRRRPASVLAAMWPLTALATAAARISGAGARVVVADHIDWRASPLARSLANRLAMRASMAATYPLAHGVVGVSQGVAESVRRLSGLPTRRLTVIHNPLCLLPSREAAPESADLWPPGVGPRLISIGRFKAEKDQATLFRALAQVRRTVPARLLLLGEGALRPKLEDLRGRLCLEEAIAMPGFRDPAPHLRRADLLVMSSCNEGFCLAILEALAEGVKVVSTDCLSGPRELLEDGRLGRLAPIADPQALAAAILDELATPRDRAMLRRRADDFAPDRIADRYLAMLLPDLAARTAP